MTSDPTRKRRNDPAVADAAAGPDGAPKAPPKESVHVPEDDGQRAAPPRAEQGGAAPPGAEQGGAPPPEGAAPGEEAGAEVGADLDELVAVAAQRDEYLALAQRTQADFENYRKRMSREVGAAEARGMARLARELLPALDNLQRALEASEQGNGGEQSGEPGLAQGIRLVQNELLGALARMGIERYEPHGEQFDPNQHEAMAQAPVENADPGTVVEVYQPGYRLGESIIRPARVVVAA